MYYGCKFFAQFMGNHFWGVLLLLMRGKCQISFNYKLVENRQSLNTGM